MVLLSAAVADFCYSSESTEMVSVSAAVADFCCCHHYAGPWLESGWRSVIGFIERGYYGTTLFRCYCI